MAKATRAPESALADAKTAVIKVRNAASIKLSYLRTLATKLVASSRAGIASTVTFLRRAWGIVPVALIGGSVVGGMTSTKKGYLMFTGIIGSVIKKAYSFLGAIRLKVTEIVDYSIQLVGKVVGKVSPTQGQRISVLGYAFTDKREQLFGSIANFLGNLGNIVKNAYEHEIVARIVPVWSSVVGIAMIVNYFTAGLVSALAANIPVVGAFLVSVLAGGWAILLGILCVASLSALVAVALKSDDVVANVVETTKDSVATSEIKNIDSGTITVNVVGDVSPELAEKIAEKHIEAELVIAEAAVKEMSKPKAQTPRPKGQPSKNKKKK